jgi:hypothetical protein
MNNVRIFCEGKSDQRFLRDFISVNYGIEISDKDLNNKIHCLEGWNKLEKLRIRITEEFSEYTSLIFLDADDEKTEGKKGLQETKNYVDGLMQNWDWNKYDTFVFPDNNEQTGEIEDFFENIIKEENKTIFDCWADFENCLSKTERFNVPAKKSKIYVYHEALHGNSNSEKNKCKDSGRDFKNTDLWCELNSDNPYLNSLRDFLDKYLK